MAAFVAKHATTFSRNYCQFARLLLSERGNRMPWTIGMLFRTLPLPAVTTASCKCEFCFENKKVLTIAQKASEFGSVVLLHELF